MNPLLTTQAPPLFQRSLKQPYLTTRGVHLDLKGMPPHFSRLLELLELFAKLRFNLLLIEWEDMFPWQCDPRFANADCYTPEQVKEIAAACERLGLEIVPLVQSLGHAENVLNKPGYEDLREIPGRTDVFHPLHPESPELVLRMVRDILDLLPNVRRFHLGGDEVYTLGQHPESINFIAQHGHEALYLKQLEPSLQELEKRGIRPLLWHDEFIAWGAKELAALSPRVDLLVWGYSGDPRDTSTYHYRLPHAQALSEAGFQLWAVTAHKGADGPCSNIPNPLRRQQATLGWVELDPHFHWQGVITSGWSRYSSGRSQVDPLEASLDSLVNTAIIFHDGIPPQGGIQTCRKWLNEQPEAACFEHIQKILAQAEDLQSKAWTRIRQLEEQRVNLQLEPYRADSGIERMILDILEDEVRQMCTLEQDIFAALEDFVPGWCIRNLHQVRVTPIIEATARLRKELLSPEEVSLEKHY